MKYKFTFGALAAFATLALCSFQLGISNNNASADDKDLLKIVEDIPTAQAFLKDPIPEADIERIVNAGVNAPSAMNKQPWHFTIISNTETIKQLAEAQKQGMKFPPMGKDMPKDAPKMGAGDRPAPPAGGMPKMPGGRGPKSGLGDSPLVIIVSCADGGEFDAGLACECMNDMANMLGYGTKIASSVKMLFDGEKKAEYYAQFQIPDGQHIVTALLIGKVNDEAYDAVTSATPRNAREQVVTILK